MASLLADPITLGLMLFFTPFAILIGNKVLGPLVAKPRAPKARWQAQLSDILILLFQMGVAGLILFVPSSVVDVRAEIAGLAVMWSFLLLWWWLGIRHLSRNEVHDPLRRAVMLGILNPIAYCWPLTLGAGIFTAFLLILPMSVLLLIPERVSPWIVSETIPTVRRPARKAWVALAYACCLGVIFLITTPLRSDVSIGPVYYKTKLTKFQGTMLRDADVQAIQQWFGTLDFSKMTPQDCERVDSPDCVRSLSHDVVLTPQSVKLYWGGGFGHWGLEVAPKGTPMPPSTPREYHLPLGDGAWVWHEIQ